MFQEDSDMLPGQQGNGGLNGDAAAVILAWLKRVEAKVERVDARLQDMFVNRSDESREHGAIEQRLKAQEDFKRDHESEHRAHKNLLAGAIVTAGLALAGVIAMGLFRIFASRPDVLK